MILLPTIQSARSTKSSSLVTVLHPPVQSNLKITKRSFRHAAPHLWNKLPSSLRIPSTGSIPSFSDLHHGPVCDLSYGAFHSRLRTHLFFQVLSSIGPFPVSLTDQLEHLTVRCVVGSGVSNVDKCGRLSQPSWLLGAL